MTEIWAGKLSVYFPRATGTAPAFYNYWKTGRPIDAGYITENDTLVFGHQVRALIQGAPNSI